MSVKYYDSQLGSDAAAGTEVAPRRTLAQATTDAAADATLEIRLRRGRTFRGSSLTLTGAGSWRVLPYGPSTEQRPVIDGESARDCIVLAGTQGATIAGIKLTNGGSFDGVSGSGALLANLLRDLEIDGGQRGLDLAATGSNADMVTIEDSVIKNIGQVAMRWLPATDGTLVVRRCKVHDIGAGTTAVDQGCVLVTPVTAQGRFTVEDLTAWRVRGGIIARHIGPAQGCTINRTFIRIEEMGGGGGAAPLFGVYAEATSGPGPSVLVRNSVVVVEGTLAAIGLCTDRFGIINARGVAVINLSTGAGGNFVALATDPGGGAEISLLNYLGCISYIKNAEPSHGILLGLMDGSNFNAYHALTGGTRFQAGSQTFAAWKTATSLDANSIEDDPEFPDPGALVPSGYIIEGDSPLVGAGTASAANLDDILGYTRITSLQCIGPVQFVPHGPLAREVVIFPDMAEVLNMAGFGEEEEV